MELFEVLKNEYPIAVPKSLDVYIGIFEDVYDLLDNADIDGVKFRDIIISEDVTILSID